MSTPLKIKMAEDRVGHPLAIHVSVVLVTATIVMGICSSTWDEGTRDLYGGRVVALWVFGPPLWMWFEWTFLTSGWNDLQLERLKHSHDLARNLWIAFVVVVALLFDITWPAF